MHVTVFLWMNQMYEELEFHCLELVHILGSRLFKEEKLRTCINVHVCVCISWWFPAVWKTLINQYGYLYNAFCASKRFTWQVIEIAQQNTLLNTIIKITTKSNLHTHTITLQPIIQHLPQQSFNPGCPSQTIQRPGKTGGF